MGCIFTGGASVSEIMDLAKRMESKGKAKIDSLKDNWGKGMIV